MSSLEWTGERMVPEGSDALTFWEHIYRYKFASQFVQNKMVLDIACGEGYGMYLLKEAGAKEVCGIDCATDIPAHINSKYQLNAHTADACDTKLPDQSFDLVVSYETIEHLENPSSFCAEIKRLLKPAGLTIISTPNRNVYKQISPSNPFHFSEMTDTEFTDLLKKYFSEVKLYSQFHTNSAWHCKSALSARDSFWIDLKGAWRIRNFFLKKILDDRVYNQKIEDQPLAWLKNEASRKISFTEKLFCNYLVRDSEPANLSYAKYLIAVCKK